jgi:hypothetical protein
VLAVLLVLEPLDHILWAVVEQIMDGVPATLQAVEEAGLQERLHQLPRRPRVLGGQLHVQLRGEDGLTGFVADAPDQFQVAKAVGLRLLQQVDQPGELGVGEEAWPCHGVDPCRGPVPYHRAD